MEARFQDETDGSLLGGPRAVTGVGDDTETVCAGRKVAVNSGSRAGRFVPLAVISLEQVTEPDALGRTEADGGELHLYGSVSGAEPDLLRRSGPEPAARGHLFDHDAGGSPGSLEVSWVKHHHSGRRGKPHPPVRIPCAGGKGISSALGRLHAVGGIEAHRVQLCGSAFDEIDQFAPADAHHATPRGEPEVGMKIFRYMQDVVAQQPVAAAQDRETPVAQAGEPATGADPERALAVEVQRRDTVMRQSIAGRKKPAESLAN